MKVKCKVCLLEKEKIKVGRRRTGSIFLDETGLEWNGRTCPNCNVDRTNRNMKHLREDRKRNK